MSDQVVVDHTLLRRAADQVEANRVYLDSLDCESACGGMCREVNSPCILSAARNEAAAVLTLLNDAAGRK